MFCIDRLGILKMRFVKLKYLLIMCLRSQIKRTSKALTPKMTFTLLMRFSFLAEYISHQISPTIIFFLFWWKRSIQIWATFLVLVSATTILNILLWQWGLLYKLRRDMSLLCNEDDSLNLPTVQLGLCLTTYIWFVMILKDWETNLISFHQLWKEV